MKVKADRITLNHLRTERKALINQKKQTPFLQNDDHNLLDQKIRANYYKIKCLESGIPHFKPEPNCIPLPQMLVFIFAFLLVLLLLIN